ncbi:hypothetical protein GN157_12850 [Flavobacterium rakeshii]|uniref:Uncharacterized protein n=1 Tax=Flavobacterium rakeshii TaxID=1038845 RepID=A0A6N8HFX3_9FLAO|nr:hypothetical protein [Flavobacterium rakeshii]MUV04598.1 hypothetical protein [Flavobacterium rakeshii]
MEYPEIFIKKVFESKKTGSYIGTGNPNSKILIVGKETATDIENKANGNELYLRFQNEMLQDFKENANKWSSNIERLINVAAIPNWTGGKDSPLTSNPLFPFKSLHAKELREGQTWSKYQKLHDLIFLNDVSSVKDKEIDFHNNFFLTEMNSSPAKFTKDADKSGIPDRKKVIEESAFFQNFPVVILACSNYINGKEIEEVFKVKFDKQFGSQKQLFWTHYNTDKTKLVIHTRQLSTNVSNNLLIEMANEIRDFLK